MRELTDAEIKAGEIELEVVDMIVWTFFPKQSSQAIRSVVQRALKSFDFEKKVVEILEKCSENEATK